MTGLLKLDWANVKSALVSGVLTAVLAGAGYIIGLGDIFAIDLHAISNVVGLAFLTTLVSLVKALLTTNEGNFVGAVNIDPRD